MAGEIEAKLKAERMFAEAKAKAIGGPYANISKEYVDKYMDSSSLSKALADRVSTNYSIGYLSGWAGIPGDMLNALTSWAVSGIPDQRLRQQAKTSLTVAGTEDIGEAMGADVESEAFQWGTVGLPGLEDLVKKSPYLSMVLFHGTPHKFKKFDISKIGTGEGAQAFGHGLYFAENPKVAGEYQKVLSGTNQPDVSIGGIQIQSHKGLDWDAQDKALADINNSLGPVAREVAEYVQNEGYSFTLSNLEDALTRTDGYYNLDAGQVADAVDLLKGADVKKIPAGHLYEVDIDDEVIEKFLDWDAPLSEQPEVMKRLKLEEQSGLIPRNTITPDMSGEQAYNALARGQTTYGTGSKEEASKFLADRGIPGIRFYDGNSRLSGRPFKQVKREFLKELPEDAEFDDLLELVGTGHFTKEQDNVIRELQKNDWLGFDYPSQAINAAYADNVRNWDPTDSLLQALDESAGGANRTRNIVVFDPETSIKKVKRDGELVYEDLAKKSPYLAKVSFGVPGKGPVVGKQGKLLAKAKLGDTPHQYDPVTNTIQLDKRYWKSLSSDEKLQLLRHEEGHSFFSTKMENGETIVKDLAENNKDALREFANNRYLGKELKENDSVFHYQEKAEEMLAEYWADRRMGADLDYWDNLGVTEKIESAYQKSFSSGKN